MLSAKLFVSTNRFAWKFVILLNFALLCIVPACLGRELRDLRNRSRLEKLRLLSERLADNLEYEKSNNLVPRSHSSGVEEELRTLLKALRNKRDYWTIRAEKRRVVDQIDNGYASLLSVVRRSSSAMDDFHRYYTFFYNDLSPFVNDLKSRYTSGTPSGLTEVDVLREIMTPDDPDFSGSDGTYLIQKFYIIYDVLNEVFAKVGDTQVQVQYQTWFSDQKDMLEGDMTMVLMTMGSLVLESGNPEHIKVLSAGVGGINTSLTNSIGVAVLQRLQTLISALNTLPYV